MSADETPKHESTTEPGVFYWAERVRIRNSQVESWCVVAQAPGGPKSEAHDDWLTNPKDADEIAQMLARGEEVT